MFSETSCPHLEKKPAGDPSMGEKILCSERSRGREPSDLFCSGSGLGESK